MFGRGCPPQRRPQPDASPGNVRAGAQLWKALAQDQYDTECLAREGRILHDLGVLYEQSGRAKDAEVARREALAIRETVLYRQSREALGHLARTYSDLGNQVGTSGSPEEGRRLVERAIEFRSKLSESYQDLGVSLWLLAEAHSHLARIHMKSREYDAALGDLKRGLEALERASPDRRDTTDFAQQLGINQQMTGEIHLQRRELEPAKQAFQAAMKTREGLVEDQPNHPQYRSELYRSLLMLGNVGIRTSPAEAAKVFQRACEVMEGLAKDYPNDANIQSQYAVALHSLANAVYRAGQKLQDPTRTEQFTVAAETFEQAISVQEQCVEKNTNSLPFRKLLAYHYRSLAEARTALRQSLAVVAAVQSAAAQSLKREKLSSDDPALLMEVAGELSLCIHLLGAGDAHKTEREKYVEQAIAIVRRAVERGFNDPERFKQPDFAPLRGMPEFDSILKQPAPDAESTKR